MDKLRKALSGQDSRDNDSSTGILPVSMEHKLDISFYNLIYSFHCLICLFINISNDLLFLLKTKPCNSENN